ncbi:MAG: OmpH family outer membrane protein [Planctomycetaceae bacterium]|nr:OmpH family outer membrane protein [Planctomycetaceae bacterium]
MKASKQLALIAVLAIVLTAAYQYGTLNAASSAAPAKIGVINVTDVLENSQKHKAWQEKMQKERTEMQKEFEAMKTELDALQANLNLRTPGTEDYLNLQQEFLQKKAVADSKNEFYRTKVESEMLRWTEELYQKMLKVAEETAKAKGLDMVMSDEGLDLPAPSLRDFMLTIKTKKMIYHNPQYDITQDVLDGLNKAQ